MPQTAQVSPSRTCATDEALCTQNGTSTPACTHRSNVYRPDLRTYSTRRRHQYHTRAYHRRKDVASAQL